ncbi:30S ribosomal protein S1 [Pajaroellobacter abortibovis]|uniref:S1 motif domain-containing protein n=1 Tax=Pajaroellobacter abortibovis TaxID=1882918 RepID=A0A1L6MY61_9BACT|nr:S1 RNA-binding domain-containing protein [Pajaroellobacter abortibovis]APS00503.1 hypothetical protein BCY86_07295 [Pajaroellobacter abortibovis]
MSISDLPSTSDGPFPRSPGAEQNSSVPPDTTSQDLQVEEETTQKEEKGESTAAQAELFAAVGKKKTKKRRRHRKGSVQSSAQEHVSGAVEDSSTAKEESQASLVDKDKKKGKGGSRKRRWVWNPQQDGRKRLAFAPGDMVFGKIVAILEEALLIDLLGKAQAIFDRQELEWDTHSVELSETGASKMPVHLSPIVLEVGAHFTGMVCFDEGRGGNVVLTRHPERAFQTEPMLEQAARQKKEVMGLITGVIRGGVEVSFEGVRAFAPASHVDMRVGADLSSLIGKRLPFFIKQYHKSGRDIIVSRKPFLEAEAKVNREVALGKLKVGVHVQGIVKSVVPFGVFVDVGGVEGLIALGEMSHNRGDKPHDLFKVGDTVDVKILRIDEKKKVWLSRKALMEDPWLAVAQKIALGSRMTGRVVRMQPFGAFVELEPGVDGLIYTPDFSFNRIKHPSEAVQINESIDVIVVAIDHKARRITLHPSLTGEAAHENPQRVQPHQVVRVVVMGVETGRIFVRLLGVTGRHARGFIPAVFASVPHGTELRKAFPNGTLLDAKVVEIDSRRGEVKLSIRAVQTEAERVAYQEYRQQVSKEARFTLGEVLHNRYSPLNHK